MSSAPLVSVVMATRNAERFLSQALDSVAAQTYEPLELIVVDKSSADGSVEIAESYGARCVQQRGSGYAGAWNEGIELAQGALISLLDSDDFWVPEKTAAQVRLLTERPELDYVIGRARFFIEPGYPPPPGVRPELLEGLHVAPMPGVLMARRGCSRLSARSGRTSRSPTTSNGSRASRTPECASRSRTRQSSTSACTTRT